uniref:CSON011805 protein n=1 Tax=Culicoides sonorensis TaxID=179676 RepID=A0A336MFZ5_CULSO
MNINCDSTLLFSQINEKYSIILLLSTKIFNENMQTLPMIDLVYNTLTTIIPSQTQISQPYDVSYRGNELNASSSSTHNEPMTSTPWTPNKNLLFHLDKHQILLGSSNFSHSLNSNNYNMSGGNESEGNFINGTYLYDDDTTDDVHKEFIFDRTDVRIIFITLYSLVFCCCFFGNLLVILVVTMSRRLRSITNFFLANLAVADLCVGVFCVFQNLSIYLIPSWVLGDFLCKMYQFVHSLSYTASIFILVVICMERYFAIIHPITCKQILTSTRLRLVIIVVWITSGVYSIPKFIFVRTITNELGNGQTETICIAHRKAFNAELFDLINFALLYILPLLVMTILYSRIGIALWKSSRGLERHIAMQNTTTSHLTSGNGLLSRANSRHENKRTLGTTESQVSVESEKIVVSTWRNQSFHQRHHGTQLTQVSHSASNVLRARRGVIRMLLVVLLTFALCNLPFHARKMWQHW